MFLENLHFFIKLLGLGGGFIIRSTRNDYPMMKLSEPDANEEKIFVIF